MIWRRRLVALSCVALVPISLILALGGRGGSARHSTPAEQRRLAVAALEAARLRARPPTPAEREREREAAALDGVLAYTPFISRGSPNKREVALTFDDGPSPYTTQVLAALTRARAPATFFVIGEQLKDFGTAFSALVRSRYPIGNHTQTHPMMAQLSRAGQAREMSDQDIVTRTAGAAPERLYRPPYGSYDATTLGLLKVRRALMVLWTVDSEDYTRPGTGAIVRTVLGGAEPGAIVLMHDGGGDRSQTVAAVPAIVRGLRARGYRLVTVPQLLLDDPPPRSQGPPPNLTGG